MKVKYYDLENKRVFITGGGSGIGASIVEHFCEQGSEVYFIDINVSESKKLIDDYQVGVSFEPENKESFLNALSALTLSSLISFLSFSKLP